MFILLKELFERDNVPFPEWLSYEHLEEDWKDSKYSFERNKHIWSLKTPLKDVRITFDGNEYHFIAFDEDGNVMFDNVTTDEYVIQH